MRSIHIASTVVAGVVAVVGGAVRAGAPPPPDYRARVELADKDGAPHAIVTTQVACSERAKCPEWTLDLGRADAVELIAVVDLLGEPRRVRYAAAVAPVPAATLPGATKLPAAVVRTLQIDAARTQWERWAIISLEGGRAKLLWRGEIAMTPVTGGGFTTVDGVELVATEPGKPLALAYAQSSVPGPNDKPRRPNDKPRRASPMVRRRFVVKNGAYQRE